MPTPASRDNDIKMDVALVVHQQISNLRVFIYWSMVTDQNSKQLEIEGRTKLTFVLNDIDITILVALRA